MTKLNTEHERIVSPTMQVLEKFKHYRLAMIGFFSFISLLLVIIGVQLYIHLSGNDLAHVELSQKYNAPSLAHIFATYEQGRDLFIRVLAGGWISIQVGLLSTFLAIVFGVSIGAVAGFFGGKIDGVIMRGTEIVSSFPFLAIAMSISAIFIDLDVQLKLYLIILILVFLGWTGLSRMVRGQILSLRDQEFIIATRALAVTIKLPNTLFLMY